MNSKIKILVGILVVGIVLVGGWWIWSFVHPEFCLIDADCRYEKWDRACINKYAFFLKDFEYQINPPPPLSFESFYIEKNMPCRCIDKKCIGDIGILCKKACEDWKAIDCTSRPVPTSEAESVGITAREAFFQMNCEKKINCKCLEKQVIITTDKTEYEQGETVKITVFNGLTEDIFVIDSEYPYSGRLERKTKTGEWEKVELLATETKLMSKLLKPGEKHIYSWNQIIGNGSIAEPGIYRMGIWIGGGKKFMVKFKDIIYSNEFIIK